MSTQIIVAAAGRECDTDTGSATNGDAQPTEELADPARGSEAAEDRPADGPHQPRSGATRVNWQLASAISIMAVALVTAYFKWAYSKAYAADEARSATVQTAATSTIAMLSYNPDTVEQDLRAAGALMTGGFKDSYESLTRDVVIPGAKQKRIAAAATVAGAASVSADEKHAVVMLFVNQTTTVGNDPPTDSASTVRVTLEKVEGRWLVAQFDPV